MKDSMIYTLQPSSDKGWFVCTDTESGIVVKFRQGYFNESQKITHLHDLTAESAASIASDLRGIGEYLANFYPEMLEVPRTWRKNVGRQIRTARELRGMTQQELADMSRIDRGQLARIEGGRANPTLDTLGRIASALDIEIKI